MTLYSGFLDAVATIIFRKFTKVVDWVNQQRIMESNNKREALMQQREKAIAEVASIWIQRIGDLIENQSNPNDRFWADALTVAEISRINGDYKEALCEAMLIWEFISTESRRGEK